jgi:hypothetical protein
MKGLVIYLSKECVDGTIRFLVLLLFVCCAVHHNNRCIYRKTREEIPTALTTPPQQPGGHGHATLSFVEIKDSLYFIFSHLVKHQINHFRLRFSLKLYATPTVLDSKACATAQPTRHTSVQLGLN